MLKPKIKRDFAVKFTALNEAIMGKDTLRKHTRYVARLAYFKDKYEKLKTNDKSLKPLYVRSMDLWLLAYDLRIQVDELVSEVLAQALMAKKPSPKSQKPKRSKDDKVMVLCITRHFNNQKRANEKNKGLLSPSLQRAYQNYQRRLKKIGVDVTISAIKKRYQRMTEGNGTGEDD